MTIRLVLSQGQTCACCQEPEESVKPIRGKEKPPKPERRSKKKCCQRSRQDEEPPLCAMRCVDSPDRVYLCQPRRNRSTEKTNGPKMFVCSPKPYKLPVPKPRTQQPEVPESRSSRGKGCCSNSETRAKSKERKVRVSKSKESVKKSRKRSKSPKQAKVRGPRDQNCQSNMPASSTQHSRENAGSTCAVCVCCPKESASSSGKQPKRKKAPKEECPPEPNWEQIKQQFSQEEKVAKLKKEEKKQEKKKKNNVLDFNYNRMCSFLCENPFYDEIRRDKECRTAERQLEKLRCRVTRELQQMERCKVKAESSPYRTENKRCFCSTSPEYPGSCRSVKISEAPKSSHCSCAEPSDCATPRTQEEVIVSPESENAERPTVATVCSKREVNGPSDYGNFHVSESEPPRSLSPSAAICRASERSGTYVESRQAHEPDINCSMPPPEPRAANNSISRVSFAARAAPSCEICLLDHKAKSKGQKAYEWVKKSCSRILGNKASKSNCLCCPVDPAYCEEHRKFIDSRRPYANDENCYYTGRTPDARTLERRTLRNDYNRENDASDYSDDRRSRKSSYRNDAGSSRYHRSPCERSESDEYDATPPSGRRKSRRLRSRVSFASSVSTSSESGSSVSIPDRRSKSKKRKGCPWLRKSSKKTAENISMVSSQSSESSYESPSRKRKNGRTKNRSDFSKDPHSRHSANSFEICCQYYAKPPKHQKSGSTRSYTDHRHSSYGNDPLEESFYCTLQSDSRKKEYDRHRDSRKHKRHDKKCGRNRQRAGKTYTASDFDRALGPKVTEVLYERRKSLWSDKLHSLSLDEGLDVHLCRNGGPSKFRELDSRRSQSAHCCAIDRPIPRGTVKFPIYPTKYNCDGTATITDRKKEEMPGRTIPIKSKAPAKVGPKASDSVLIILSTQKLIASEISMDSNDGSSDESSSDSSTERFRAVQANVTDFRTRHSGGGIPGTQIQSKFAPNLLITTPPGLKVSTANQGDNLPIYGQTAQPLSNFAPRHLFSSPEGSSISLADQRSLLPNLTPVCKPTTIEDVKYELMTKLERAHGMANSHIDGYVKKDWKSYLPPSQLEVPPNPLRPANTVYNPELKQDPRFLSTGFEVVVPAICHEYFGQAPNTQTYAPYSYQPEVNYLPFDADFNVRNQQYDNQLAMGNTLQATFPPRSHYGSATDPYGSYRPQVGLSDLYASNMNYGLNTEQLNASLLQQANTNERSCGGKDHANSSRCHYHLTRIIPSASSLTPLNNESLSTIKTDIENKRKHRVELPKSADPSQIQRQRLPSHEASVGHSQMSCEDNSKVSLNLRGACRNGKENTEAISPRSSENKAANRSNSQNSQNSYFQQTKRPTSKSEKSVSTRSSGGALSQVKSRRDLPKPEKASTAAAADFNIKGRPEGDPNIDGSKKEGVQLQFKNHQCQANKTMSGDNNDSISGAGSDKDCSVRVAVRIRPQNPREKIDMCRVCTETVPGEPQIILGGGDKSFTFDYVFDTISTQSEIYDTCVERLVEGALHGYNATVLAYGQTGSGKTYTMGTGFDRDPYEEHQGIIPRAVRHIFSGIETQSHETDESGAPMQGVHFSVAVQFMELYNEDIIDLLDPYNKSKVLKIHEDTCGQISVAGITIKPINDPKDALQYLQQGALARTTASTQMNDQSSRSHALFTILIRRQRIISSISGSDMPDGDLETLTSKFHFVDLAGSERLKRTGATGERAREGISINCGLLSLGNCISALGDKSKKATHVPYRDSKLTRLLQDSLGGNSQTIMIACISPSDRDFMETLNTLKYANRARNIKNKVQVNQDQSSRAISLLRREIAALQMELLEYKQGKRVVDAEGNSTLTDTFHENVMLMADNKRMQQRLKAMQETINCLTDKNAQLKLQLDTAKFSQIADTDEGLSSVIADYVSEIEKLQAKLIEQTEVIQQRQKQHTTPNNTPRANPKTDYEDTGDLINLAKRELEKDRELVMSRSLPVCNEDNNESADESSDSDTESDEKANEWQADLNDINNDIELKTKLIEQLELTQQRLEQMRAHYEEKLNILQYRIANTQKERDEVLANLNKTQGSQSNDRIKKVREEYERKLSDIQRDMKKLQQAHSEYIQKQKNLRTQEVKINQLRSELNDLKRAKAQLIKRMSEQTSKHKAEENRKNREIAKLRKEQRKQLNEVKTLQAHLSAKEKIIKRRTEEVTALRRNNRGLSQKAAGRVPNKHDPNIFNHRVARQHFEKLLRCISRASRNKQTIARLEHELEQLVKQRETLSQDLASLRERQREGQIVDIANEEDSIKTNLTYVQDNISTVQQAIMDLEEGKDSSTSNGLLDIQSVIGNLRSVEEAKFLLEQLVDSTIMYSCDAALRQNKIQEQEALLQEAYKENSIQSYVVQHFLFSNKNVDMSELMASLPLSTKLVGNNALNGSQQSLHSNETYDIPSQNAMMTESRHYNANRSRSPSPGPTIDLSNDKIRRRTAQPQDLLFGDSEVSHNGDDAMTRSYNQPHDPMGRNLQAYTLMRVPSAPGSLKQGINSPSHAKKTLESSLSSNLPQSPRATRRAVQPTKSNTGLDEDANIVPQSPPVYRRMVSREETNGDVFSRLGAGTQDPAPGGSIQKITTKIRVGAPLYWTHTVSGHNNAVLSIKVDDETLYTAAADRTVKVWNLSEETALHCLSAHPGPVVAVEHDPLTRLVFSASGPYVRVWDLRTSNAKPIKTLSSSGQVLSGSTNVSGVAPGESPITALCLGGASGNLYVASSDKVRIWDLKSITCVGKLSGGHQAAVMCITSWEGDGSNGTDFVATGSKDHYVKVFEVPKIGGLVYPLLHLEPPHYDGVQALAVAKDAIGADAELFSGSRDSGIKRWDLKTGELKQSLNNAHKGWVSGMAISGDILLSGCRGGIIRLWNVKTCESVAEMKTDLVINDIVASGQRVFTASSDGKVRLWRFTNTMKRQCSLDTNS